MTEQATTPRVVHTRYGVRVNVQADLCETCAISTAQSATYWTDDSNFTAPGDEACFTAELRFTNLQRIITDNRNHCRSHCGRVEVTR